MQVNDDMVRAAADAIKERRRDEIERGTERATYEEMATLALNAAFAHMWRPIEEAPKDRPVLVTAYIVPSDEARRNGSEPFWDVATGRAYGTKLERWSGILGTRPSHWMPLPAPPKTGGE